MNERPTVPRRAARAGRRWAALLALGALGALAPPAPAVTHLERGDPAPLIALADLDGAPFSTVEQREHTLVLVFGEIYHDRTLEACGILRDLLKNPKLAGDVIEPVLIVAQTAAPAELKARATDVRLPARILPDPERRAFGVYRVAVMPSVVVVDEGGRVVHAIAGLGARFADVLTDALLVAAGRLSPEEFDRSRRGDAEVTESPDVLRARRTTNLARQLVHRGLEEMAAEEYQRALELVPDYTPARLGWGALLLRSGRLAEAETQYRAVLATAPGSTEASLGLGYLLTLRGADELAEAERLARHVLAENPIEPRAHYLLGLVHLGHGRPDDAAGSFRAAAELLMERREAWDVVPRRSGHDQP